MRDATVHRAATMYYLQGQTMEAIATHLHTSRSSVSRMLSQARESGIVRISVVPLEDTGSHIANQLHEAFGVRAWVVPVRPGASQVRRLSQVAAVAAENLMQMIVPGTVLGFAWGNTTSEIVHYLPHSTIPDVTIVQLNGAASRETTGVPYVGSIMAEAAQALGARSVHFPVPAFFDYPETKEAMWREGSVRQVLELQRRCSVAVFGVGGLTAEIPSHVYSSGYLSEADIESLAREHVVGDVCTVFIRENGTYRGIALNQRATGPTPDGLRRIERRLCVVAGQSKASALLGALRAQVATDLVVDEQTARQVLRLAQNKPI
ncbi:MAG: sugar-binding transcriptional regulator [Actinomycetaceae bacterium]|nr:sugar-binding transcriptional regulator [Actinomycetaceae bacterium]MDU0969631.1 sugar-binding transcriptional regulator [Actinomycetaceae bacterium]